MYNTGGFKDFYGRRLSRMTTAEIVYILYDKQFAPYSGWEAKILERNAHLKAYSFGRATENSSINKLLETFSETHVSLCSFK